MAVGGPTDPVHWQMMDPESRDYTNGPASSESPMFDCQLADTRSPPAITVVTPVHNKGRAFRERAGSMIGESSQQWEWLIINDGSSAPEALDILGGYREMDPQIRVVGHPSNQKLSAASNTRFQLAGAPYFVLLPRGDLLEPTALEKWLGFLNSNPSTRSSELVQ